MSHCPCPLCRLIIRHSLPLGQLTPTAISLVQIVALHEIIFPHLAPLLNSVAYNSKTRKYKIGAATSFSIFFQLILRTRLIGFAALTGALSSEALYNDTVQFRAQVAIILKPILVTMFQADLKVLDGQYVPSPISFLNFTIYQGKWCQRRSVVSLPIRVPYAANH